MLETNSQKTLTNESKYQWR